MLEGRVAVTGKTYHLSFDDGFRNLLTNAAPILSELGVPALAFVPTAYVGSDWHAAHRFCHEITNYSGVIEFLSWSDLRELSSLGVEIGSHTQSHARLSTLSSSAALSREICDSKRELEHRLGRECRYISWPWGGRADIHRAALDGIKEGGYRACFGGFRGRIEPEVTSRWSLPRHHFEPHWPLAHVRFFCHGGFEPTPLEWTPAA